MNHFLYAGVFLLWNVLVVKQCTSQTMLQLLKSKDLLIPSRTWFPYVESDVWRKIGPSGGKFEISGLLRHIAIDKRGTEHVELCSKLCYFHSNYSYHTFEDQASLYAKRANSECDCENATTYILGTLTYFIIS